MKTDSKIIDYTDLAGIRADATRQAWSIVLTTGCYDLLHLGHTIHLSKAKEYGDILVVSVGNDETLRDLKGPTRPIYSAAARARMLAALSVVDYVVISREFGKMDHTELVRLLRPDVYAVPGDDSLLAAKQQLVEDNGGRIVLTAKETSGDAAGMSTTQTEGRIRQGP